ncbi:MAG: histone deacetylase [Candidatus Diapherotrites archaeon]
MKLYYNELFLQHETGNCPENPSRLQAFAGLKNTPVLYNEKLLNLAHDAEYISAVKLACEKKVSLFQDVPLSLKSFETAVYAASLSVKAAEDSAFALLRPPGHHASFSSSREYCIFNNIAIATLSQVQKGKRVFVLDFDLHHGDGTESLLRGRSNLFYASLHQHSIFPGTGMQSSDNILNIPLAYGTRDTVYVNALEKKVAPALKEFRPDIVALSAGFDCYYKDQNVLGEGIGFSLTKRSFEKIRELVKPFPHFVVLEGGYRSDSLREGVSCFVPFEEWV